MWDPSQSLVNIEGSLKAQGWTSSIAITDDDILEKAIQGSWYCVSAFDAEALIGVGRLPSDGAL